VPGVSAGVIDRLVLRQQVNRSIYARHGAAFLALQLIVIRSGPAIPV
jgi:hypothetical protein